MIRSLKLTCAVPRWSLPVCDCTYLANALVRQAEARLDSEHKLDAATTAMLYDLAGDAMYLAAGASKSPKAAAMHRLEGDGYYAKARRCVPVPA